MVLEAVLAPGAKAQCADHAQSESAPNHRTPRSEQVWRGQCPGSRGRQARLWEFCLCPASLSSAFTSAKWGDGSPRVMALEHGEKGSLLQGSIVVEAARFGCPEPRVTVCSSVNLASSKES